MLPVLHNSARLTNQVNNEGRILFLVLCAGFAAFSLAGHAASSASSNHWSLQPLVAPQVPVVRDSSWPQNPVDRFILATLESKQMKPTARADKALLLRRVTFDLIGLPPTPAELESFLKDNSRGAYEKVVDRLLKSPRYGERWARHWLDVVHYADTHGNDQDRIRTNAWPYRDYLVRSFNEDKPYARFVQEQLAGDILFPGDPQGIVATGFIAAGPWDESSQMAIMDDTVDKKIAKNLDRDDMVTTTMSTFASSTVHCARCHNHKFDPISQDDYYSLQAVFAGVDRANRTYDRDPALHERRRSLIRRRAAAPTELELEASDKQRIAWERSLSSTAVAWKVLEPASFTSSNGSTLTKQSDFSVLASGKRPETDTYTIICETALTNITAIRLEVLSDESLPHKGPGRQDNGNLHLSELALLASPARSDSAPVKVALRNATADFNQDGWDITRALDGNTKTAWGIYPSVGKSHTAVFETATNLDSTTGTRLVFQLDQLHGGGHLIGRVRLAITSAPRPVRLNSLPDPIAAILAVAPSDRSPAQQKELASYHRNLELDRQIAALPPPEIVYAAANDFVPEGNFKPAKTPRAIHVLKRGDVTKPGDAAVPGALACVNPLDARFRISNLQDEGERRSALAHWLTDPANPLTWRSIVNRVWHYHFGRGIVETPNDFGKMGGRPSHPELLDWLAVTFRNQGGSLKQLHRLIVTSAVYMQSSGHNPEYAKVDSGNIYLWRMNRARLDAESLRDAVLAMTGKMDLQMGGPPAKQFNIKPGVHVTPDVDYLNFDVDSRDGCRRSIYRFIFRTLPDPFMDSMDCADASQLTPARNTSVTALQALSMLNNHFMVRYSEHFASRLERSASTPAARIEQAFILAYSRKPTSEELVMLAEYAQKHGLANLCRLILNSNEFVFVN